MISIKSISEDDLDVLYKELIRLRKILDYKNRKYCKRFLDSIIHNFFKTKKEEKENE